MTTDAAAPLSRERFTARLEAFSDLVFGFSLSLVASRLDVPARPEEVLESKRWFAIILTFALVCRFWLEHYRVFRHQFVAGTLDMALNFIFLFGIAVLPYAVQCFLRFPTAYAPFALYAGDFSFILFALTCLRLRSLRQRRDDPDRADRLRAWRRSLMQLGFAIVLGAFVLTLGMMKTPMNVAMQRAASYFCLALVAVVVLTRSLVAKLPEFLS